MPPWSWEPGSFQRTPAVRVIFGSASSQGCSALGSGYFMGGNRDRFSATQGFAARSGNGGDGTIRLRRGLVGGGIGSPDPCASCRGRSERSGRGGRLHHDRRLPQEPASG